MKSSQSSKWILWVCVVCGIGSLVTSHSALAYPWNSTPQPLIHLNYPNQPLPHDGSDLYRVISADAGSPLAWDSSARMLWYVAGGDLQFARWTAGNFTDRNPQLVKPNPEVGLLADSGWHALYCVNAQGRPQIVRKQAGQWTIEQIGSEPVTRLLATDAKLHQLFAYDAAVAGIRAYSFDPKTKTWSSAVIASGLGAAGDSGVFDSGLRTLYTTHETAPASLARSAIAEKISDPTGEGLLKPWPLVATTWDGAAWTSRVLTETGVPQRPAVRGTDHRVYFAQRDAPDLVQFYQPAWKKKEESLGNNAGWAGRDTWVDNENYEIKAPKYPSNWYGVGNWYGSVAETTVSIGRAVWSDYSIKLQAPITEIPCYKPLWTDSPLAPRLAGFRAVINPKQSRLVQQRERFAGEMLRKQTGKQLAGYLYRDAKGVVVTGGFTTAGPHANYEWPTYWTNFSYNGWGLQITTSPAHLPEVSSAAAFYVRTEDVVFDPAHATSSVATTLRSQYSIRADAPFTLPHLLQPSAIHLQTFGHAYGSTKLEQKGGRFQDFTDYYTGRAVPSGIAVDPATGVTFYTQSPDPNYTSNSSGLVFSTPTQPKTAAPSPNTFDPEYELKFPRQDQRVWIVMVY